MSDFDQFLKGRVMTSEQVASRLGLFPEQVRKMAREGLVPSTKLSARFLVFDRVDVEAYLEANGNR